MPSALSTLPRLAGALLAAVMATVAATGQSTAAPPSPHKSAASKATAAVLKRPLMRPGRVQYCLKQLGRFDGRISGRSTTATTRALRRFSDELGLKTDANGNDWAIHAVLWRQCREAWVRDGGSLDRFGIPKRPAQVAAAPKPVADHPIGERPGNQVLPSSAAIDPQANPATARPPAAAAGACLPAELKDLLQRVRGRISDMAVCDLPCLPMPATMDRDDAAAVERRHGVTWCKSCVPFAGSLSLDDVTRIEKAGNITLCPDPRRAPATSTAAPSAPQVMIDALRGTRALFRRDIRAGEAHNGLAVVINVSTYAAGLSAQRAERDAAGMRALLVERLGYRAARVIELKNPTRAELEDVFGVTGNAKGLLSDRVKDAGDTPVLVYFSGLGAIDEDEGEAYLLPADALPRRQRTTGYPLATLYQNLQGLAVASVTVVIEATFAPDARAPLVAPNAPSTQVSLMPRGAPRGLAVITAADRDQQTLTDRDTGLSLFTRYFIEGLSGYADIAPVGNKDGGVDLTEAFVYAASRTGIAARKLAGVLQRPTISQARQTTIGKLGPSAR